MRYFSVCTGVGGLELGFPKDWECVGHSEINKYASAVLAYHYPKVENYGDLRQVNFKELPNFDLLCGGTPCQDLSIAGKGAGLDGERSGLFFTFIKTLKEKNPRYFIWENVKGSFSSQSGFDFLQVQIEMAEAGYDIRWELLDAREFGIPQKRERVFIIGVARRGGGRELLPIGREDTKDHQVSRSKVKLTHAIPANPNKYGRSTLYRQQGRVYSTLGASPCLCTEKDKTPNVGEKTSYCRDSNYAKGTNTLDKSCRQLIVEKGDTQTGATNDSVKLLAHSSSGRSGGREERITEGDANTLSTGEGCSNQSTMNYVKEPMVVSYNRKEGLKNKKNIIHPLSSSDYRGLNRNQDQNAVVSQLEGKVHIRRLTPTECERLMGWESDWTKYGTFNGKVQEISDSQRYKMCGNGVVPQCVKAIMEAMGWK